MDKKIILLITNRDSDNTGDQVIEACDLSLIRTALFDLFYKDVPNDPKKTVSKYYKIKSKAASLVPMKYIETKDSSLLTTARARIREADVVIFGGAPMFNYLYQCFYERTAVLIEIAQEQDTPVLFSAIGVEDYQEESAKCQRLKKALNLPCVKMITTRDGYSYLERYKENPDLLIGKVADPAVFTREVFREHTAVERQKKIGIFVLRKNGFLRNGHLLGMDGAADLYLKTAAELEKRGYEYEFITSGHFGDEAFLDYLIRERGVPISKCVFNINTPEDLVLRISGYCGVISTRMHPSIVSYSLEVPAVGLIWNDKVKMFYESIGHTDRAIPVEGLTADALVSRLEQAMKDGIARDGAYDMTIYSFLRSALGDVFRAEESEPYTYDELKEKLIPFKGTSEKERDKKLERKFRRAYQHYNRIANQKESKSGRLIGILTGIIICLGIVILVLILKL